MNHGSRNNSDRPNPFGDFFDDPFFQSFNNMNEIFRSIFEDREHPFIPFQEDDSSSGPQHSSVNNNGTRRPHLSLINPEIAAPAPSSSDEKTYSNENNRSRQRQNRTIPSPFGMNPFEDFFSHHLPRIFEPEYDRPKIGNVNPKYEENGRIFDDNNPHLGVRDPDGHVPRLPSPYLPNAQGNELDIPTQSYYRSTITMTLPDGQTKTITTINENGQTHTTEEVYDAKEGSNRQGKDDVFERWTPFGLPWHSDSIFRDRTTNNSIFNREEMIRDMPNSNNNSNNTTNERKDERLWDRFTRKASNLYNWLFWTKPSNDNTRSSNGENHFDNLESTNNSNHGNGGAVWTAWNNPTRQRPPKQE